jgi:hypothetical protein
MKKATRIYLILISHKFALIVCQRNIRLSTLICHVRQYFNVFMEIDKQVDILDMKSIKNGEFNVAIDKGTLDSIVVRIFSS